MSEDPWGGRARGLEGRPREGVAHPPELPAAQAASPRYEGLVTRSIAFGIDAALIDLIAIAVAAVVGLALSVLVIPADAKKLLTVAGGALFVVWSVGYFVTFWSTTGQTPGSRLLQIRVCRAEDGGVLRPRRAVLRFAALILAAIPLFAGLLLILTDSRRRGLHDMLAGSVVVSAPIRADVRPSR
jgi:uncharacterized RDD family membrane protein YckC